MRIVSRFLLAAALVAAPLVAHANTIYNFALTSTNGSFNGTGTFTLVSPISPTGDITYSTTSPDVLTNLSFFIDGQTFTISPLTSAQTVEILNGAIRNIAFSQTIGSLQLGTTGGFTLHYGVNFGSSDNGVFGPLSVGQTPEPGSLALLGTGLLGGLGMFRRRIFQR